MKSYFGLIFLALIVAQGCSTERLALRAALPLIEGQYASIQEEKDPHLAKEAMPASLKMLEGLLRQDGDNPLLLNRLAEGFCGYAFSFLEETEPDRAQAMYLRGRQYASRALAAEAGIEKLEEQGMDTLKTALAGVEKDQVPSLFWLGQCWGGWLMLSLDRPEAFADVSKIEALMKTALKLDETYYSAGPHLFLGVFYGSRSKLLGGDPEKAKFHFERNLALTDNKYLMAHYLYAKTYAVQNQNVKLFENLLSRVYETPADVLPERRLANEVAKVKSDRLAKQAEDLF